MMDLVVRIRATNGHRKYWKADINHLADEAATEIERLRAEIERLPKTKDGVSVVPGMEVWHRDWEGRVQPETGGWASPWPAVLACCYSTREAAEAAEAAQ